MVDRFGILIMMNHVKMEEICLEQETCIKT